MVPRTDEPTTHTTAPTPAPFPPPGSVSYLELATLPSAPFWARRHTHAVLQAWQLPADTTDTAQLIVSELITNSTHATAPASQTQEDQNCITLITLTLRLQPGRIIIEVFDTHPDPPVLTDADPDAEAGRGLMLVQALTKEWGHYFPPSGGKTVYAVLTVEASPPSPET